VIKTLEAKLFQVLLGYNCPGSRGIVVQEQDHVGDILVVYFLQNFLQLPQQGRVILRVDSLAFWKIVSEEDAVFIPQNQGE
jgi:hypothetical protein